VVLEAAALWSAVVAGAAVVLLAVVFWSPAVVPDGVVAAALWSAVPVVLVALLGSGVVAAVAPAPVVLEVWLWQESETFCTLVTLNVSPLIDPVS
jgi:hypothetical protein